MNTDNVFDTFLDTIKTHGLIHRGARVLMALSGGADSVVTLDLLLRARDEYALHIEAVHINHMIRDTAGRDEDFCARLCERYGIMIHTRRVDIPAMSEECGMGYEECGRRARYEAFDEIMRERGLDTCVTAHNDDDRAETIVLNFIRGASSRGLSGIPYRRGNIVRPILDIKKEDILGYARDHSLEYMTDETNDDVNYTRNFIRHELLPMIKKINPSFTDTVKNNAENLRRDEEHFSRMAQAVMKKAENIGAYMKFSRERLKNTDDAVLARVIYEVCKNVAGVMPDRTLTRRAISAINSDRDNFTETISGSMTLELSYGYVYFVREGENEELIHEMQAHQGGFDVRDAGVRISYEVIERTDNDENNYRNNLKKFNGFIYMDYDTINCTVFFTHRKEGDIFRPERGSGSRSVKRFMQDVKLPKFLRASVPIMRAGDEILWVYGSSRVGAGHEVTDKTRRVLKVAVSKLI